MLRDIPSDEQVHLFPIVIELDSAFEGEEIFIVQFQNNEGTGRLSGAVFGTGTFQMATIHIMDGKNWCIFIFMVAYNVLNKQPVLPNLWILLYFYGNSRSKEIGLIFFRNTWHTCCYHQSPD